MLNGVHFLLTYTCTFACDHCFLYCSPWAKGTFTIDQVKKTLDQASRMESVSTIFFEGGEPLLYYSLLLESIGLAHKAGFTVGMVTNGYPSNSHDNAKLWLRPLLEAGLDFLSISDDSFHYPEMDKTPGRIALEAARDLGASADGIAIADPGPDCEPGDKADKGAPVEGGQAMFRGRAADILTPGMARKDWRELKTCPYEELVSPSRVHVDAYGNAHICQGLIMGNMWETPLARLVEEYDVKNHPVASALEQGGPALLAEQTGLEPEEGYADECHLCFSLRRQLLERYPECLGPEQVYGPDPEY